MRGLLLGFGVTQKNPDMPPHIGLERIEMGEDRSLLPIGPAQPLQQMPDRHCRGLVVEAADLRSRLLHPGRHRRERFLEALLQTLDHMRDALLLLFGESLEGIRLDDPAVLYRCEDEARGRAQQGDPLLLRLLLDRLDRLLLAFLEFVLEHLPPGPIILALKGGLQRVGEILDQPFHVGGELAAEPCRHVQRLGTAQFAKIAHIAEVAAGGSFLGSSLQGGLEHNASADPAAAHDVEMAARHRQRQAEVDRIARPCMPERRGRPVCRPRQRRGHRIDIDHPPQPCFGQGFGHGSAHRDTPLRFVGRQV